MEPITMERLRAHMNGYAPVAFVLDRPTAPMISDALRSLGGAWAAMYDLWHETDQAYLGLMAHTKERYRKRAPLTVLARDDVGLRLGVQSFCSELSDVKCAWVLCMEKGSVGVQIVNEEILRDSTIRGHA